VLPGVGDDDLLAPVLEHFAMDVDEVSSPQPPAPLMAPAFEDLSEEPIADAPITDVPPDTVNEALTGQNADEALEVNNQDNVHDSTQASAAAPIAEDEIATADEMQV
jgi:hypothetical protein